jgi:hypothetical protein
MILPRDQDRGIVVFWVLPSLAYRLRLIASLALIATGCTIQLVTQSLFPGFWALAIGNLLLLVKGYDNRVNAKGFDMEAQWEPVEQARLEQLEILHKKMRRWDRSALDLTNPLGLVVLLLVVAPIGLTIVMVPGAPRMLAIDAATLLIPHWITGTRSILTLPKLMVQIKATRDVLDSARPALQQHRVVPLMLLSGGDAKIPEDVKFRIDLEGRHENFLGLYGQVSINDVQGTSYPYFYVVLVSRKGFGLGTVHRQYQPPHGIVAEFDLKGEVEVLIIRQRTTKNSGYHTTAGTAREIFRQGLQLAEEIGGGVPAAAS